MEKEKDEKNQSWWQPGLVLFARTSGWIGIPIIVALFVGKWLDRKYNTEPWLFLATIGFAFLISSLGIMIESKKAMEKISRERHGEERQRKDQKVEKLKD